MPILLAALLQAAPAPPLLYWGARPPVIATGLAPARGEEARVLELHAARDGPDLVLRLTLDRPVERALNLPGGGPVSGRLHAVLYLDADADRASGFEQGSLDLRTGADYRLELGVVTIGEDPLEKRPASALVTATLVALSPEGRRRQVWRTDDAARPRQVSCHGEWVEVRLPGSSAPLRPGARVVLTQGERAWDGRLP